MPNESRAGLSTPVIRSARPNVRLGISRRPLVLIYFERQQDIAGSASPSAVAGIDVEHIAYNRRAPARHGTALAGKAVDGFKVSDRVEFPKQLTVLG